MIKGYRVKAACCALLGLTALSIYGVRRGEVANQPSQAIVRSSPTYSKTLLRSQRAEVTHTNVSLAELKVTKVRGAKGLTQVHFVDENTGWVADRKLVFRTSDGGQNWEQLDLKIPSEASISSLFFINNKLGWLSLIKMLDVEPFGHSSSSSLLMTSDGGNTWTQRAVYPNDVEISCLRFLNDDEGIATGNRIVRSSPSYPELFVLITKDGGATWNDLSQKVNAAVSNEYGQANDLGADVSWELPARLLLLTPLGRIVSSSDHGTTWQTVTQLQGGYEYKTSYRKIHVTKRGTFRVIGDSTGDDGAWGDLTLESKKNSWTSYELLGTPIFDAISRSEDEIIVCGGDTRVEEAGIRNRLGPYFGTILLSRDAGKTWSVIYKSAITESFISLTKVNEYGYYALSDAGTVVRFTLRRS